MDYACAGLSIRLIAIFVRGETRGKVVRVMTFEAFMKLHGVDFDRKQSGSVGLTAERIVHHL